MSISSVIRWLSRAVSVFLFSPLALGIEPLTEVSVPGQSTAATADLRGVVEPANESAAGTDYRETLAIGVKHNEVESDITVSGVETGSMSALVGDDDGAESTPEVEVSERVQMVREAASNPLSLMSHHANYLLPITYSPDRKRAEDPSVDTGADRFKAVELEFQLSVQVPLWDGVFGEDSFLSLAYTNHSFWQAYAPSAPFRETLHEPELLMTWLSDWNLFGFQCVTTQFGVNHQSNGRAGPSSRGWNRIYGKFIFEKENLYFSFKPWYRLPEDDVGDDNPDIESYLGNFELVGGYRGAGLATTLMVRNNLESNNRGAVELRVSFPLTKRVRGFVKYFNGYGETLLNYSESVQSLGFGVELARGF